MWIIWDTKTNREASVACFHSELSALYQINGWLIRQIKGGRPDITAIYLIPKFIKDYHTCKARKIDNPKDCNYANCEICIKNLGWYCEKSPSLCCEYDHDSEYCIYCEEPSERK